MTKLSRKLFGVERVIFSYSCVLKQRKWPHTLYEACSGGLTPQVSPSGAIAVLQSLGGKELWKHKYSLKMRH